MKYRIKNQPDGTVLLTGYWTEGKKWRSINYQVDTLPRTREQAAVVINDMRFKAQQKADMLSGRVDLRGGTE